jgi:hypothetical protein
MLATQDYILNGEAHGPVAERMMEARMNPYFYRPFIDNRGHRCVMVNSGEKRFNSDTGQFTPVLVKRRVIDLMNQGVEMPLYNATTLRKDEWIRFDQVVLKEARARLRCWSDLQTAGLTYGGFDGMSKTMLEHETMNDPGEAIVDMDGLSEGLVDAPKFQLEGLPLPITHSSFTIGRRQLSESRNTGMPLSTTQAELAARRVSESIERTLLGTIAGTTYGTASNYNNTPTVYGYMTHPDIATYTTLTTPTGSNPYSTVTDVLAMIQELQDINFRGPYMLYYSPPWAKYMGDDYLRVATSGAVAPTITLIERLKRIPNITDVRQADFLSSSAYQLILVQMTSDVVRAVDGMMLTTLQWESKGGMQLNFKVMAIQVPQVRSTQAGYCGICLGTTS